MKKQTKTHNVNNESSEPLKTSARDGTAQSADESAAAGPNAPNPETLSVEDGPRLNCGGYYPTYKIENTIELLQTVRDWLERIPDTEDVYAGIAEAEQNLEELLEEVRSIPQREGATRV